MGQIIIAENGRIRNLDDVQLVENIIKTKNNKSIWETIDKLVKLWAERTPDDVQALKININQYKETLIDKEYGTTRLGKEQERRFTLAFPYSLQQMIRSLYKADELPFNQAFYREFLKRYPAFRVAEKS